MGNAISIIGYTIRVRRLRESEYLILDDCINGDSLFNVLSLYFAERQEQKYINEDIGTAIKAANVDMFGLRLDGKVKIGKFGFGAEIQNLDTDRVFNRGVTDCQYIPLYFAFDFREGQDEGIVLLQKFGPYSAKGPLTKDLNEFILRYDEEVVVEINPLVCDSMIEEIIGGGIKQIRYIRNHIPADVADDCKLNDNIGVNATMETVIKARRDQFLDVPWWMRDFFKGRVRRNNLIDIQEIEYDDVKVKISRDGKPRNLSLSDIEKLRMSFDITEDVRVNDDGHPELESIREISEDYLNEFRVGLEWHDD